MVNLYDCLYHNIIEDEIEEQVKSLMGGDCFKVMTVVPVQQQNSGSDCGVFAAAFATCLVNYVPPETVQFDFPKMRQHSIVYRMVLLSSSQQYDRKPHLKFGQYFHHY